jgi:histidinol phosphatase-like enzyme
MDVIFLDIDGVLNCDDTPNPRKFPYVVDPHLLSILEGLLVRTANLTKWTAAGELHRAAL